MFLKSRTRPGTAVALAMVGSLALAGCTGSGDSASSSSATTSSSTSSSTAVPTNSTTSSSSAPLTSSTSSVTTSSSTTPTTSSSSSSTTSTSSTTAPTKPAVSQALINACVNANSRSNAAVTRWNSAVRSQKSGDLDSAANNFRSTAAYLRTLTKAPGDKQFTPLVWKVAKDFDDMADARKARRTVSTSTYNTDAQKMRQYCTTKISA